MSVLLSAVLAGCQGIDVVSLETGAVMSPHFVTDYIVAENFDLYRVETDEWFIFFMNFRGERISMPGNADKDRFETLAEAFGDVSYNRPVVPDANRALVDPISSLNVVCNKDYDAGHEAGSDLCDIVKFWATTPYGFIHRGYVHEPMDYSDYWPVMYPQYGYDLIDIPAGEVNSDNSIMLDPWCYLYFTERPAQAGEYEFSVTITTGGRELSNTATVSF